MEVTDNFLCILFVKVSKNRFPGYGFHVVPVVPLREDAMPNRSRFISVFQRFGHIEDDLAHFHRIFLFLPCAH